MSSFFKNSVLGLLTVICRLGSSFLLNKMVASYFGPAGIAQLAHFQNLITFFTLIPNDGINRGVIKYLAANNKNSAVFHRYFKAGLYLTLLVFSFIAITMLFTRTTLLTYFPAQFSWLNMFLLGAFILVVQNFLNAVLLATKKNGWLFIGNLITALSIIAYVAVIRNQWPLPYFLLGYLVVMGSFGLIVVPFGLKGFSRFQLNQLEYSSTAWHQLSKFILMAASVLLFSKGLEYYIRDYLIRHYSMQQTGLWQGVVRISDSYTALYSAVLAYAFYPKIAALLPKTAELKNFVRSTFFKFIPILIIGLSLVYLTRQFIINMLLSSKFVAAQDLLPFQLIGDFCKMLSWLLANILVVQAKFKIILIFEAFSALAYLGLFHFFTEEYGLAGTPLAHCGHYIIFLTLNVIYFRKLLR